MSRSYCFHDVYTGERMTLDQIDKELCEATQYPYSDKTFCPRYDHLVMVGFACLMWAGRTGYKSGAWHITDDMLRAYSSHYQDELDTLMPQMREYLAGGRYCFSAWG